MATQPPVFPPGTLTPLDPLGNQIDTYSNIGYMMLCMVIERKTNLTVLEACRGSFLNSLGINRISVYPVLPEHQTTAHARYDDHWLNVGKSVMSPGGRIVPYVYGADIDSKLIDGSGGIAIAGPDMARILAALNVPGAIMSDASVNQMLVPTVPMPLDRMGFDGGLAAGPLNGWKSGMLVGTEANLHFVKGGTSFFVAFNKDFDDGTYLNDFQTLRTAITNSPGLLVGDDLFPSFGMKSL
jgi:CubicO group peptidase (beta-lactamase class C family)